MECCSRTVGKVFFTSEERQRGHDAEGLARWEDPVTGDVVKLLNRLSWSRQGQDLRLWGR